MQHLVVKGGKKSISLSILEDVMAVAIIVMIFFFNEQLQFLGCFRVGTGMKNVGLIKQLTDKSLLDCQHKCEQTDECQYFNWNSRSNNCFLRSDLVYGSASFTQVTEAIVGAKDCSSIQIIWPEIYPNPRALSGITILETTPSTENPPTKQSTSYSTTTSFSEIRSQQTNQYTPGPMTSVAPSETESKATESNPSSPSLR